MVMTKVNRLGGLVNNARLIIKITIAIFQVDDLGVEERQSLSLSNSTCIHAVMWQYSGISSGRK